MVRRALKWIGIVAGALAGLLVVAVVGLSLAGGARLNRTHAVQAEAVAIPTDEAALARGEHMVNVACKSCHGDDLSGQVLIDDPTLATVYAANVSGIGATHSDADLVRAIRHGVDQDGRQLFIMPAEAFINFSAEDLGAIIAHLKTVPRAGDERPTPRLTFLGRVLLAAGMFGQVFPAEYIDHGQPFRSMPAVGSNVEYGAYLANFCTGCHGPDLSGGRPNDPDSPPAPNLTPGGRLASWSEAGFLQTIRSGVTPEGAQLNPRFMPWQSFAKLDDEELKGLWLYLQTVPARAAGDD